MLASEYDVAAHVPKPYTNAADVPMAMAMENQEQRYEE